MIQINLNYLEDITAGDKEVIIEMLQLLIDESPKHIQNMQNHAANSAWDELGASAHTLKPMMLYIGLTDLHELVQTIEQRSKKQEHLDKIPDMVQELELEFQDVLEALVATKAELS